MITHLPGIIISSLLFTGPLTSIFNKQLSKTISFLVLGLNVILTYILITHLLKDSTPLIYVMGGFSELVGISFKLELINSIILFLILFLGIISLICTDENYTSKNIAIFILNIAGLIGLTMTNDLFNAYVFLEIISLTSYGMIINKAKPLSYIASFRYLVVGTIAACIYLIGIGLIYANTGHLNITYASQVIAKLDLDTNYSLKVAEFLIYFSFICKALVFPINDKIIEAYLNSSLSAVIFISGIISKVMIYFTIKLTFQLFNYTSLINESFSYLILILSLGLIIIAAFKALKSNSLKTNLALSSVNNVAYLFSLLSAPKILLTPVLLQMLFDALTKPILFIIAENAERNFGSDTISAIKKLCNNPLIKISSLLLLLALIGFPLSLGFISKATMINELFDNYFFFHAMPIILGSALSFIFLSRFFISINDVEVITTKVITFKREILILLFFTIINLALGTIYSKDLINFIELVANKYR
ncbi:MAG: hypothetical protein J0H68_07705 [Sphingobacteriia bacterium]|nr:hypothetical protein [Sphingobacteriia bacterium]